ncbi:MAG: HNH endonuclease [Verrucomicrobiales bacterium]|nr:HNH endonuclease [Verrucomicrobiales bacterium]
MRKIADANAAEKDSLLAAFLNDSKCGQAFASGAVRFRLHGLAAFSANPALAKSARDLFERFYKPQFDAGAGYSAPGVKLAKGQLDRPAFVSAFARHNDLGVCPYCDGTLTPSRAEVDHFYPKSEYPFLALLPENLVPACKGCNSIQVKGVQVPLEVGATNETADWFHPYHRTADGDFRVEFLPPRMNDEPRQLRLTAIDPNHQARVKNLNGLLSLTEYWGNRLRHRMQAKIAALRTRRRNQKGRLDETGLREQLQDWAKEAAAGRRHLEFSILEEAWCRAAGDGDAQFLEELLAVNNEPC